MMASRTKAEREADLATVRGAMQIESSSQAVVVPLSELRPSVTRSDELSNALIVKGVDSLRIAGELAIALTAEFPVKKWEKIKEKWVQIEVMVPDWKTRMLAIEKIIKVRGWEFAVEKLPEGSVSRDILMIVKNLTINGKGLQEASIAELQERHQQDVKAGLIEDAEVVDDSSGVEAKL